MSDGFQVVMAGLQEAATTFHAEAKTSLGQQISDPAQIN